MNRWIDRLTEREREREREPHEHSDPGDELITSDKDHG